MIPRSWGTVFDAGLPMAAGRFPMLTTVPMGWSHAVYVAQEANTTVVYRSGVLDAQRNMTGGAVMDRYAPVHSFYIDDGFGFHLAIGPEDRVDEGLAAAERLVDSLLRV
jgi:hypothetical protein